MRNDDGRKSLCFKAEKQIKKSLVVEAVANKEGFEVTDEDKEAELENLSKQYQMDIEKVKEFYNNFRNRPLFCDFYPGNDSFRVPHCRKGLLPSL